MTTTPNPPLPRRKRSIFWYIGGGFLLLFAMFLYQLLGPNPPIKVSPQTTFITTPLAADGLPDYRQHLLDTLRKGVTPKNNAAAMLWMVMWDKDLSANDRIAIAAELGVNVVPDQRDTLPKLYNERTQKRIIQWLDEYDRALGNPGTDPSTLKQMLSEKPYQSQSAEEQIFWERADEVIGIAGSSPWRQQEIPPLAEWLAANKDRIDLLVEASIRPHFYMPSTELLDPSTKDPILLLGPIQSAREVARVLTTRAMLSAGEGRYDEAWKDALAVHRWARLVSQGETLMDQLVAIAIDEIAMNATEALVVMDALPNSLLQQIQLDLAAFTPVANMGQGYDHGERLFGIAAIIQCERAKDFSHFTTDILGVSPNWGGLLYLSTDWNLALVEFNRWYDRLTTASRLTDPVARKQAFLQLDAESHQLDQDTKKIRSWAAAVFSRAFRSRHLGGLILTSSLSSFNGVNNAANRAATSLDTVRIAASLARYRIANSEYPNNLAQLVPQFIPQLPTDSFNTKPFVYRRTTDGYLLYSVGENGIDEQGSNENQEIFRGQELEFLPEAESEKLRAQIPPGSDDLPIRIPTQPFQIPPAHASISN